jgi:benzaldehyde dehydrogenase (NAD)
MAARRPEEVTVAVVDDTKWGQSLSSAQGREAWRSAAESHEVRSPAGGRSLGTVGVASPGDVETAARSAALAQQSWADTGSSARAAVFLRAADLLAAEADAVAGWLVREGGAVAPKAAFEIGLAVDELRAAAALVSHPIGELLPGEDPGQQGMARRVPVGVVGVVTPWNFPLILAMRSVAPALALGNAVVLKPDLKTAVSGGAIVASLFEAAGLPPGVLHVLPGDADVGEALVVCDDVGMVSFTGSTRVGHRVGELAGARLKRVALELGGNNAFLVLDDADLGAAVNNGWWGSFVHQGQICMAVGRHLVHESLAEEYAKRIAELAGAHVVGDPETPGVTLGPLISVPQAERVERIVAESVAAGAMRLVGGERDGTYYPATVLTGVRPGMPAFDEEIFGPVVAVTTFATDDEAVELARETGYGLVAAVHTRSLDRGLRLAGRLGTGMVHVNDQTVDDRAYIPMGGLGRSGNGSRFGGHWSIDEFTRWQWVTYRSTPVAYPR